MIRRLWFVHLALAFVSIPLPLSETGGGSEPAGDGALPSGDAVLDLPVPLADGFDYPVGAPDAQGYYDAQGFGENDHLGEDWNGNGGGNSDLGDAVTAIATGRVISAAHEGPGWGQIVRVAHHYVDGGESSYAESFYAHLDEMFVEPGQLVSRGDRIGTIGDADGMYISHLHFELRLDPRIGIGPGYAQPGSWWGLGGGVHRLDQSQALHRRASAPVA